MIQDYAGMARNMGMAKTAGQGKELVNALGADTQPINGLDTVTQRFNRLTEQLHAELDDLTKALDPILKPSQPMPENIPPTQAGESPLFSYLQQKLDLVEGAMMRVRALRLLLDL